jgi:hypothetical protein
MAFTTSTPTVAVDTAQETVEPWDNDTSSSESSGSMQFIPPDIHDNNSEDEASDDDTIPEDRLVTQTPAARFGIRYSNSQMAETKLLKILNDANTPHYLFQDIMNWTKESLSNQYDFQPTRIKRKSQMKHLEKWLQLRHSRPERVSLTLPFNPKTTILVTRFNFHTQLHSLLTDPVLMNEMFNLDVNPMDPFGKYDSPGGLLSSVNSGAQYAKAYKHLVKDRNKDFLVPIIFACDETKVKSTGKGSCWPLVFTTSLFNQQLRNLPIAWKPLGYIYDLSIFQSKAESSKQTKDEKYARLHAMFEVILETFVQAQNDDSLDNIPLTINNETKVCNLKVPVLFIIGDIQGGDKMCCTSPSYSNLINRLCRKCNVRGDESGDPLVECQYISMIKVKELVRTNNKAVLKYYNQYNVHSAWFDVCFGGCKYGIFSAAAPIEPLHALQLGLMGHCMTLLFNTEMTSLQRTTLDGLARALTELDRQRFATAGTHPTMPRLIWKDGISSLSDITADHKVGMMLTIVVLTLTDAGIELFVEVLGSHRRLNDMRYAFQLLLCYWAWLKKDVYWKRGDREAKEAAKQAIRVMLQELLNFWPRETGQGWELAKFHEQLHVPDDIERNGPPKGSHAGPTENHHISHVKNPLVGTQHRRVDLDWQISNRTHETSLINTAYHRMNCAFEDLGPYEPPPDFIGVSTQAGKGRLFIYLDENGNFSARLHALTENMEVHTQAYEWVVNQLSNTETVAEATFDFDGNPAHNSIFMFTEYIRNDMIFRAHANYRNTGPWHDWVMFRWEQNGDAAEIDDECQPEYGDDIDEHGPKFAYSPGKLLGFVGEGMQIRAVVSACLYDHAKTSIFSTGWTLEVMNNGAPAFHMVDPASIVCHCLMVPQNDAHTKFHQFWTRERWADEFY